jgi:hypothetical protein
MKLKFGAIVVDGRNKIGGHVLSKNRAGAYMRTKVTPVNPRSSYQSNVRETLSAIASSWRGLLASEILAWNAAVDIWKKTDIFGDLKKPSGFNLFQRLNNNIIGNGATAITTPPSPVAVSAFNTFAAAIVSGTSIILTWLPDAATSDENLMISATPGLSKGISFVKSKLRVIAIGKRGTDTPYTATTVYSNKFGSIPVTGQKVFFELKVINTTTGQAGVPIMCSHIV